MDPGTDPWLEGAAIAVLLSDPAEDVAVVVTVAMTLVHDSPENQDTELDTAELVRVTEAAVARIMDGL